MVVYLSNFNFLPLLSALLMPTCHVSTYYQYTMMGIQVGEDELLQILTQGTPNDDQHIRVELHM
jgi:hypothetical protein